MVIIDLTIKQRKFADEYIISGNAADAYRKAGYKAAGDSIRVNASKLLTKPNVKDYITKRMEKLQSEKVASQQEVMEYLTRVMRREENENQVVTLKTREEKWNPVKHDGKKQLKKVTIEKEEPSVVPMPTRVSDANKAAELLGKRYSLFKDAVDITSSNINIVIGDDSDGD
ncbi:terminase small subunit (plasmid) [Fructilactobacillus ixorae]|uniref:Terminase small subunit n=1 Tax=Fructilactobacillus ixorae TaxID=1750535 RepID=A0ABY5C8T7_9LACO|nr:terminase small subunit [Fructilactobacillus ixorae]USS93993.1 terminase small subunit [Fructilactobacillus ixorae]